MGRKLYGCFVAAGFVDIRVSVHARADTTGTKLGMIRNMAAYARESGALSEVDIAEVLDRVESGLNAGTYLVVSPQFAVIARR
jgi:hypothetical protein